MDAAVFYQAWESSRSNEFSWCLTAVLVVAVFASLWACCIKSAGSRRFTKALLLVTLPICAMTASGLEIERKWQLRREFIEENRESLTEDQAMAVTLDGANRVMGPVLEGGFPGFLIPFIIFVVAGVRRVLAARDARAELIRISEQHHQHG